eukprot:NODE_1179_length_1659_cov_32.971429_g1046_i0.p1 GENE.NODE_1179_length_1659_cov_32.971429_g1046_i0~~NODE_1179_length_1659_cov_32.971429_g1046_i0.p1  ORF type:complete len:486 (+),score=53.99 NODE_1179_length_1659_cov_32.971429_g1046_i0:65-1522(+)
MHGSSFYVRILRCIRRMNHSFWRSISRASSVPLLFLVAFGLKLFIEGHFGLHHHNPIILNSPLPSPAPFPLQGGLVGEPTMPESVPTLPDRPLLARSPAPPVPAAVVQPNPWSRAHTSGAAALSGAMGAVAAMTFSALGAGYGIAKTSGGVTAMGFLAPEALLRGLIPVVMAELLGMYGFISALNIVSGLDPVTYSLRGGFMDLAAGLTIGLSCLAAGLSIGTLGDANIRTYALYRRMEGHRQTAKSDPRSEDEGPPLPAGQTTSTSTDYAVGGRRVFAAMILMLIFAEGIGLYGLIVSLLMHHSAMVPISTAQPSIPVDSAQPEGPCPSAAGALFGALGVSAATGFSIFGAAYGIARAGTGVCHLGLTRPERMLRGTTPVVLAELLAIYGFVSSLIIALGIKVQHYSFRSGLIDFAAGLTVGLGCLAGGLSIGVIGDVCTRAYGKQAKMFMPMILMLIFAEALGLYALIAGLVLHGAASNSGCP